jgi:Predicted membrane protein (DUF2232)
LASRDSDKHMNNPTPTVRQPTFGPWAIGVIAGLVSAVLFASASTGTLLGLLVLFFLSPLPIGMAGLGWGVGAAIIAAVSSCVALGLGLGAKVGMKHLIIVSLPTAVSTYYLLLNRVSGGDDKGSVLVEWYPLGRIIAGLAAYAGCLAALSVLVLGTDIETIKAAIRPTMEQAVKAGLAGPKSPAGKLSTGNIDDLAVVGMTILPIGSAAIWFAFANFNLWLAALINRKSERLERPWPDLTQLVLPRVMLVAFAVSVAISMTGGVPGLLASGFATVALIAYLLIGLAMIHNFTHGIGIRPGILWAVYVLLFIATQYVGPLLALLGLAEPLLPWRRRAGAATQSPPP